MITMNELILIAFATAAVSFTISVTTIFNWLRELVSPISGKVEELIHCPWCLGHYISFVGMCFFREYTDVLTFIIEWFAVIALMGVLHYILLIAYTPIAVQMAKREVNKLRPKRK